MYIEADSAGRAWFWKISQVLVAALGLLGDGLWRRARALPGRVRLVRMLSNGWGKAARYYLFFLIGFDSITTEMLGEFLLFDMQFCTLL
jgi:hypothetical protein